MNEKAVSRRGIFQQLFINGVDAVGGLLSETSQPDLTPDEAGHLLRRRKTGKKETQFHIAQQDTAQAPDNPTSPEPSYPSNPH